MIFIFCKPYLHLHGFFDPRRDVYVFDFISQAADPPLIRGLVDGVDDVGVQGLPFLWIKQTHEEKSSHRNREARTTGAFSSVPGKPCPE